MDESLWDAYVGELARRGGGDCSRVRSILAQMRAKTESIEASARQWISEGDRDAVYRRNRAVFAASPCEEASVFCYISLAASSAARRRAAEIQRLCASVLGAGNWNGAPLRDLHATVFTMRRAAAPIDEAAGEADWRAFRPLLCGVRRFLTFVTEPRLTAGAVVLRCEVYEPTLFAACDQAARRFGELAACGDHATVGYICGGGAAELKALDQLLRRVDGAPVAVETPWLGCARTVNKALRERHPNVALRAPQDGATEPLATWAASEAVRHAARRGGPEFERLLASVRYAYGPRMA